MLSKKEKNNIEKHLSRSLRLLDAIKGPGINLVSEITPHLFLSSLENALIFENLKSFNINCVFHLGTKIKNEEIEEFNKRKINYINYNFTEDETPGNLIPVLNSYYVDLQNLIKSNNKIVICCKSGLSVSAAVLLFYFMKRYYIINYYRTKPRTTDLIDLELSVLPDIIQFLKDYRPCIDPNSSYIYQILLIELQIKKNLRESVLRDAKEYIETPEFIEKKKSDPEKYEDIETLPESELIRIYLDERFS